MNYNTVRAVPCLTLESNLSLHDYRTFPGPAMSPFPPNAAHSWESIQVKTFVEERKWKLDFLPDGLTAKPLDGISTHTVQNCMKLCHAKCDRKSIYGTNRLDLDTQDLQLACGITQKF